MDQQESRDPNRDVGPRSPARRDPGAAAVNEGDPGLAATPAPVGSQGDDTEVGEAQEESWQAASSGQAPDADGSGTYTTRGLETIANALATSTYEL